MPFWFNDDWSEHFDVKIRAEKESNGGCDVLVSPVAWTSMEQVVGLRKTSSEEGMTGRVDENGRRFRAEVEHLAANWDSLTAGEMSCIKCDNGSAVPNCLSFEGRSAAEDIYRSIQQVFQVVPGVADGAERFSGAWGAALKDIAQDMEGQEYGYVSRESRPITYRLSVSLEWDCPAFSRRTI
jgi:hypothetical protein